MAYIGWKYYFESLGDRHFEINSLIENLIRRRLSSEISWSKLQSSTYCALGNQSSLSELLVVIRHLLRRNQTNRLINHGSQTRFYYNGFVIKKFMAHTKIFYETPQLPDVIVKNSAIGTHFLWLNYMAVWLARVNCLQISIAQKMMMYHTSSLIDFFYRQRRRLLLL